jgi:hypothetical protein
MLSPLRAQGQDRIVLLMLSLRKEERSLYLDLLLGQGTWPESRGQSYDAYSRENDRFG